MRRGMSHASSRRAALGDHHHTDGNIGHGAGMERCAPTSRRRKQYFLLGEEGVTRDRGCVLVFMPRVQRILHG